MHTRLDTPKRDALRRFGRGAVAALWLSAATWSSRALAADDPARARYLDALEQQSQQLIDTVGNTPEKFCTHLFADARHAEASDPQVAAVHFALLWQQCPQAADEAAIVLDAARVAAMTGNTATALGLLTRAATLATAAHELAPAVETFAILVDKVGHVEALPPLQRYIEIVGHHGRLDAAGYETLYRLGRTLARQGDPRGVTVLANIAQDAPAARRALYVRGVWALKSGDGVSARQLFVEAAELRLAQDPDADTAVRDAKVREAAWLAVGRLAFDKGDTETGFYAYQQVVVHSTQFTEAFLELGWLAMEAGNQQLALLAFEPLIGLDPQGEVGRRAALLQGYVMLHRKQYDAARDHYEAVAKRYRAALVSFDRAVTRVKNLADLGRDCSARTKALQDPDLNPMMGRIEVEAARRLDGELTLLATQGEAGRQELRAVEGLIADARAPNPLTTLRRARADAALALQQVNGLLAHTAAITTRRTWVADNKAKLTPPGCCNEPLTRLRTLRATLESLVLALDRRQEETRVALEALRQEWLRRTAQAQEEYGARVLTMQKQEEGLVRKAAEATRADLHHTAMEGDAGVLEAIWRFKEDHRETIRSLESERRQKMAELQGELDQTIFDLYGDVE